MIQPCFAILGYCDLTLSQDLMWEVINACVIMHDMIIESEGGDPSNDDHPYYH
jgi:hypothetical protein